MPKSTQRYKDFLSNYNFYTNSIHFRILSSKALEKFKNVQSFQLNQLINSKHFFKQDRREILLLKYDMWSRWIYEVENLCIELSGSHEYTIVTKDHIDLITELANKTATKYTDIITLENSENFDPEFATIWLELHKNTFEFMLEQIEGLSGYTFEKVFTRIVDILCEILQYTLLEIHELDALYCTLENQCENNITISEQDKIDRIIPIVIGPFAYRCFNVTGRCITAQRIEIYKKYFKFNEIYLKNYLDDVIPVELMDMIEETNVKINYKRSLTKHD